MPTQSTSPEIAAFHALPLALITLDLDGTIQAINPAASRLLNLPAERLLGTPFAALHSGAVLLNDLTRHADEEDLWSTQIGSHHFQIRSTPIWNEARKQRSGTVLQIVRQTDTMIAERNVSRLLLNLATEMATPLTQLQNLTFFLLHNLAGPLTGEQRDVISSIGQHLSALAQVREQGLKQYWELQEDGGPAPI
jgi:PAS domain-containing protein